MTIAIFGAGSVGAFIGGSLLAAGADVVLIGRARMRERIMRHGLSLSDLHGHRMTVAPQAIRYEENPAMLEACELILVTVKSADTPAAAQVIARHAAASATVISLQNGIGNADVLRTALPGQTVLAGMVPFNVVQTPDGRFHRGTQGELMVEASPLLAQWHALFRSAHLPLIERTDFTAVQWGKLLLNLNNPVNALSGIPLKAELSQRPYRRCLALLMGEALAVLDAAGIKPAKLTPLPPHWLPRLMRLPDPLFKRIAAAMLRIDPEARSSMWEDLQAGRRTEIDYLNGAVVNLAQQVGVAVPANRKIIELIRLAEAGKQPALDGVTMYRALDEARVDGGGRPLETT